MRPKLLSLSMLMAAISPLVLISNTSASVAVTNAAWHEIAKTTSLTTVRPTPYRWVVDPSPNYGNASNLLESVSAASPNDVWAVGVSDATISGGRTLIEHSNGGAWQIVDSPNVGPGSNILIGSAALSHNDAWAAGAYYSGSSQFTLIEHWNGTSWNVVPSPNPAPSIGGNAVLGMSAVSSKDIWAVGAYNPGPGTPDSTMILHWNGLTWQIVPSPNVGYFNALSSVSARSRTDAWAVGMSADDWSLHNARPLAMHWDGTSWSVVSVPMPADATDAYFESVSMGNHNNVWAVGTYKTSDGNNHGLALRWNGEQWTNMPGFSATGDVFTELRGVSVNNSGDVWAIGWGAPTFPPNPFAGPPEAYPGAETVVLRWSHIAWSWFRADSPNPGVGSQLMGLATFANRAWTVGNYLNVNGSPNRTLIEHYGGNTTAAATQLDMNR